MLNLALPLSCGVSVRELAGRVEETAQWVKRRLAELRDELERLGEDVY
jgi:hypothetical protein